MMVRTCLAGMLSVAAVSLQAASRPEISWSLMHPTAIDTNYMARVAAKAVEYGGVDSFEVCGDCHRGYSGLNGLSLLERYPHAHAKVDAAAIEGNRRAMNAICEIAHGIGKPLYYWHREIFIPDGLLEDLPGLLDGDGEFDLLGKPYQDWLRYKLDETFRYCPNLDGVVLTLTEADYSVIHNSNPKRYPPQEVVEKLVGLFAEEHEKRGKRFILRSFGSNSQDYIDIIGGAKRAAVRHGFEIETKVTEADFVPWLPKNPFLKKNPPLTLGAECDALGEYLSAGYLPAAQVGRIREYVASAREEGVDRYAIRIDRIGNSIFDSAHEINLYAYMRFIADPSVTADAVVRDYSARHFGAAADEMTALLGGELEMIRNIHYVASNLVFHSFPLRADLKMVKAGGIFSVYRENSSLEATKDIWSILSHHRTPTHGQILAEKEKGCALAESGLAKLEALKDKMPADEYARQHRAFSAAVKAAKALRAFARCCVAYFEDMAARRDEPSGLRRSSEAAVAQIEALMTDPAGGPAGRTARFGAIGENLDPVYFAGLRYYCRELLNEYACERALRRKLEARADVLDFVTVGGIYDDNRTIRTMHGAYTRTLPGRVVRQAGNAIFPNGTVSVRFRDVPGARVEVALDPTGSQEYELRETTADGIRTVTVGKKGRDYPALLSIALVRPVEAATVTRTVQMLPGEHWWGICSNFGREMPFTAETDFSCDLRKDNYGHQALSLLVSDKGRVLWCTEPVGVNIVGGKIALASDGASIEFVENAGANLAQAYRFASRRWFAPTGEPPELLYFSAPQYNTWIELTYHQNEKDILAYAESMLDNGLPPGVFMIDDTWQAGYGDWRFDPARFPDPKGMMDKLHAMGYKVLLWMCPFVSMDTPAYRRIQWGRNPDDVKGYPAKGGFLLSGRKSVPEGVMWWNGTSALLDFTHPNAVAWFDEQLRRLVCDYGADGFKFDGGSVSFYTGARALSGKVRAFNPAVTPVRQSALYGDFALRYKGSEYRNAFGFAGKPVVMRLHDKKHTWGALQRIIPDLLAAGFVGCPFICPDMVGGGEWTTFLPGAPFDQELFVRSAQLQALCGMMQFSASPWRLLDSEKQQIIRDLVKMRQTKFAGRFVTLAKECARSGEPMVRHMDYVFPGNGYGKVADQFVMGDFLVVAPVVAKGATSRAVLVPPGKWMADDGRQYTGPCKVTVAAPLSRLPYFARMQ